MPIEIRKPCSTGTWYSCFWSRARALPQVSAIVFGFFVAVAIPTMGICTPPAPEPEVTKICPRGDCRRNLKIRLNKGGGELFEKLFPVLQPVVQAGKLISIFPGETLAVEARREGDRLVDFVAVSEIVNPQRTLEISFEQVDRPPGAPFMLLKIKNPFPGRVAYRAHMMLLDERTNQTSTCPIDAGLTNSESWPEPIFQLLLDDFRFIDPNGPVLCQ